MRRVIRISVVLGVFVWGFGSAFAEEPACTTLHKKICKSLGKTAFYCDVFGALAKHKLADQARCLRLVENWTQASYRLYRKEQYLKEMGKLGNQYGKTAKERVERYKAKTRKKEIAQMLIGAKREVIQVNPKACEELAKAACRDLGAKAFFCESFRAIQKHGKASPKKCQLVLSQWAEDQKQHYLRQETLLRQMAKMASKSKKKRKHLKKLKIQEFKRLVKFLETE